MVEFLSDEWIRALASAGADERPHHDAPAERLEVEPVVRGVPGRGEVRYRLVLERGACSVHARTGTAPQADVRFETDYATAVALARGDTNAQAALADGRLTVSGDVARLAAHAAALAQLDDRFGAVRAATTFPLPTDPSAR